MKTHTIAQILVNACVAVLLAVMTACSDNPVLNSDMPREIQSFVTQYYPNTAVIDYSHSNGLYHVRLKDGPGMTFNDDYAWLSINGYGYPLPQVLIFDQLPPALYMYLQETETTDQVFAADRDVSTYTLQLLESTLTYNIATQTVTQT